MKASKGGKTNAARQLDGLGIKYELVRFEPDEDDLSAETAADAVGMERERVYKTLVLRGDRSGIVEACLPAGSELDLKALASASGNKRVEMVHVKELPGLTGYVRGGCSPLGGKKRYPVFIHEDALLFDRIAINAGERGLMFVIDPNDLVAATSATPAAIARPPASV